MFQRRKSACTTLWINYSCEDWPEVSIKADDEQVEHGGVGGEVVKGEPGVADDRTEGPAVEEEVHGEEWHGNEADDKVGDGKTEEVVVGDGLELLVNLEGEDDHDVAKDGDDGQEPGDEGNEDHLPRLVRKRVPVLVVCYFCIGLSGRGWRRRATRTND